MNIRDIIPEILLIVLMALSGIVVVSRLWQDALIAVGILVLILCFGGLLLQLIIRVRRLEEEAKYREKMMRSAMEDLGRQLVAKQDKTAQTVVEAVGSLKSRMYRYWEWRFGLSLTDVLRVPAGILSGGLQQLMPTMPSISFYPEFVSQTVCR